MDVRRVAIFSTEPVDEIYIIAAVTIFVDIRKWFIATFAGDGQLTVFTSEAALFGFAGFRVKILNPVSVHFFEHAVTVRTVVGDKLVDLC